MAERDVIIRIRAIDEASAIFRRVALAAGAFVSFFALRRGVEEVVGEFIEAEASSITLAAALRATGEAAGFTADELEKYADELMHLTTVDDDAFKRIMGIMATFRNVSGEVFKESIELVADMSVQFGGLEQGAIRLGKALNDPVLGMNALSRVGIQFSETQKKSIELFVEQGNLMAAQKIILAELTNQFGGQARAQVNSFGGAIAQLANSFDELKENMGKAIAEIPGIITGIQVATVAVENIGLVWDILWLQMQLKLVGFLEDFEHTFTVQMPEIMDFFKLNWMDMLITLDSASQSFWGGLAKNIFNALRATSPILMLWFAKFGTGLFKPFEFASLTEGFESTIGEFPGVTKRVMTDVEKAISGELLKSQELLAQKIADMVARLAAVGKPKEPEPPLPFEPDDDGIKGKIGKKRGGLEAREDIFLQFGRGQQDSSRRALSLAEKADKVRRRQEMHQEQILDLLTRVFDPSQGLTVLKTNFK